MVLSVDLNCDMGESFGATTIGNDEVLMAYVSSVNIACGFHGGDPGVMHKTVALAARRNLAIGAHPGYPDLEGFGRREMNLSPAEIYNLIVYQVGALMAFARAEGTRLHHVKPHGALYNTAAKDRVVSEAIARAVRDVDPTLVLMGLSGSYLIDEGSKAGLQTCSEAFADRTYQDDGSLTPRALANALIGDAGQAARQVLQMVQQGTVTTVNGKEASIRADTVCIHGDGGHAVLIAKSVNELLRQHGISIKSF